LIGVLGFFGFVLEQGHTVLEVQACEAGDMPARGGNKAKAIAQTK